MVEALLQIALENLVSFLQKSLGMIWGVNEEMEKLSSAITTIKAVLEDAEEKQITDRAIKNWLRKLKDATNELDNILEECSREAIRLEYQAENSARSSNKFVETSCLSSIHPNNILFSYRIGKRMKKINKRLDEIAQERTKFHLCQAVVERRAEIPEWRQTSSIICQPQVYGREWDKEKIVEFLVGHASSSPQDLSIYTIVGLGGLGKTTLTQLVFNDERVAGNFELKIWVCVSEDFSLKRVMRSIIESTSNKKEEEGLDLDLLQRRLQEILKSKRYLLVLDDVWNEDQEKWDRLKYVLACGSKGASILVTTRLAKVASVMGTVPPLYLSCLSEDDCWSLFKQRAFGPEREEHETLLAIGKEIVRRCGGVPLAAKALGSLLRFKREEREWLIVKESELWNLPQDEYSVLPALRLSYFNLSLKLRQCFAYCAIFVKDEILYKEKLIHLWMANGFISSNGILGPEEVGNDVCAELCLRSLFQEVRRDALGDIISFKMHDLVHDLAQSVMEDECRVVEDGNLSNLSRGIHHLRSLNEPLNVGVLTKGEYLRTILLESNLRKTFCYKSFDSPAFRSLRALTARPLKWSSITIGNLIHLRYLNLSTTEIRTLPKSIYSLWNLQTLILQGCIRLHSLPKQLRRLRNLRHLDIRRCYSLSKMPPKIGELTPKNIKYFHCGAMDAKDANLVAKTGLRDLSLSWSWWWTSNGETEYVTSTMIDADHDQILDALQPPPNLMSLTIQNYRGVVFPNWMRNIVSALKNLARIELGSFINCLGHVPLGKLPHLRSLDMHGMRHLRYIDNETYDCLGERAFPSLEVLKLNNLPNLERLLRDDGATVDDRQIIFPRLSKLYISSTSKLVLPRLPSVRYLFISGCNGEAEELLRSISNCYCLTTLKLQHCRNVSFPDGMMRGLTCLKELDVHWFGKLLVLPNELIHLTALQKLEISACDELESFPEQGLQGLISLQTLRISSCCRLKSLSEGFQHLTSLQKLQISYCPELIGLPNSNCHLTSSLKELDISYCVGLQSLSEQALQGLTSLQTLRISKCPKLKFLSEGFRHLTSLQNLEICSCPELLALPNSTCQLTSLCSLTISNDLNLHSKLPEGFQCIPSLQILKLSFLRDLTSLPDCLGDLTSLQQLEISYCPKLVYLPMSIQRLTKLQVLKFNQAYNPELLKRCKKETGERLAQDSSYSRCQLQSMAYLYLVASIRQRC
ncbi:Disease resistance protein [Quillaja saponaria]|uniref:Disease resistance protein n=1 Tax=Quillaja saponaria TaxID=32244 RepID=A0AAD7Q7L7_QUISA|nr:Disease resistance protein [Quillaja saponaria]